MKKYCDMRAPAFCVENCELCIWVFFFRSKLIIFSTLLK